MTLKTGFYSGAGIGVVLFLIMEGILVIAPAEEATVLIATVIAGLITVIAIVFGGYAIIEGKTLGGTTVTGLVAGVTTTVDLYYILRYGIPFI